MDKQIEKKMSDQSNYGIQHMVFAAQEYVHGFPDQSTSWESLVEHKEKFIQKTLKGVGEALGNAYFWNLFMEHMFDALREQIGTQDLTGEDLREKMQNVIMPLVNTLFSSHERLTGYGDADEVGMAICLMEELRLLDEMQVYLETKRKNILGHFYSSQKQIRSGYKNMFDAFMETPVQVTV